MRAEYMPLLASETTIQIERGSFDDVEMYTPAGFSQITRNMCVSTEWVYPIKGAPPCTIYALEGKLHLLPALKRLTFMLETISYPSWDGKDLSNRPRLVQKVADGLVAGRARYLRELRAVDLHLVAFGGPENEERSRMRRYHGLPAYREDPDLEVFGLYEIRCNDEEVVSSPDTMSTMVLTFATVSPDRYAQAQGYRRCMPSSSVQECTSLAYVEIMMLRDACSVRCDGERGGREEFR